VAKKLRDDRIEDLENQLKDMAKTIAELEKKILELEGKAMIQPKVHRIPDIEKIDVIYQEDPVLKERNKMLQEELEVMAVSQKSEFFRWIK